MNRHCVIPCGSGLGLLSLEPSLQSGIAKPQRGQVIRFTKFGSWRDFTHVEDYINNFVSMTHDDCDAIYKHFPGRFRPVVTCLEQVIMGTPVMQSINNVWISLTTPSGQKQSLYDQLQKIANNKRAGHLNQKSILGLFKTLALEYFYGGISHLCTDKDDLIIVQCGLGQLGTIYADHPIYHAEKVSPSSNEILVAYVDEPMVSETLYNYFRLSLPQEILELMSTVGDAAAAGKIWERYIPIELMAMFDGKKVSMFSNYIKIIVTC